MDEIAANHQTGAAFARLAMDSYDVSLVQTHPLVQVLTESVNHIELWGIMVIKSKVLAHIIKTPI